MIFTTASLLLLPAMAVAQVYGPPPPPAGGSTTTTSAAAVVPSAPPNSGNQINVDVAFQGNFVFNPPNITAPVGSLVTFFFPNNGIAHSVTQSSFAAPCTYLAATSNTSAGFDSGLQAGTQFTINITDTSPIWFHCKQIQHCGMGMVGSINANTTGPNTFDAFLSAAKAIGSNEVTETDNGPVTGGVHADATATPAATFSASASAPGSSGGSSGNTSGALRTAGSAGAVLLTAAFAIGFLA